MHRVPISSCHVSNSSSPSCTQCRLLSLRCRYQEGGKRGLPAAYMTSLETRLAETETALSATMVVLQDSNSISAVNSHLMGSSSASLGRARSKAEKQDEWKRLPLQTSEQLIAWLQTQRPCDTAPSKVGMLPPQNRPPFHSRKTWSINYLRDGDTSVSPVSAGTQHALNLTRSTSITPMSSQDRLKECAPPIVPNASNSPSYSSQWRENYF